MLTGIPKAIDSICELIAFHTKTFHDSSLGQWMIGISFIGPLTFIPTIWNAWTLENIDALRTATWPMMTIINLIMFFTLCHSGSWQMRLLTMIWIFAVGSVALATLIR